jgi:hypothetical protein
MGVETATFISQLSATNPLATDPISQGDDQIRLVKDVLQKQFTTLGAAAVTTTAAELNLLDGKTAVGDASGPGSSTDNAIARFNGTGGKTLQNSSTTISDDGDIVVGGTTPTVTIGDGGEEDTMLIYDGHAQDYRIGLDDGTDKLEVGVGSTHGTTISYTVDSSANVDFNDNVVSKPDLKDYAETVNALGDLGGGTDTIDLTLGNVVTATVSTGTQTFTFTNPSASGKSCSFTLILTNGGSQTVNWPGSVDWAGGSAPSLTTSGIDVLTFFTIDAGTIWYGFPAGLEMG